MSNEKIKYFLLYNFALWLKLKVINMFQYKKKPESSYLHCTDFTKQKQGNKKEGKYKNS